MSIFHRLPAYYRESPGLIEPLVDVAEELVSLAQERFRREEDRMTRKRPQAPGARWPSRDRAARMGPMRNGTVEHVLSWLEERYGASPQVWTGLSVTSSNWGDADDSFQLRRSLGPSAVLAWDKVRLPAPPPGFDIPEDLLPVGVNVEAVLATRGSWKRQPLAGERIQGEIFWRRAH